MRKGAKTSLRMFANFVDLYKRLWYNINRNGGYNMATRIYGYARVSATEQNLERQLDQLRHYITDERYIICDKASGKTLIAVAIIVLSVQKILRHY